MMRNIRKLRIHNLSKSRFMETLQGNQILSALHWTNSKIPISSQVTRCELQLALEFDSSHRNFHLAKSLQRHASLCVKHVEIWLTFCIIIFLLLRKLKCERAKSMGWKWKFLKYLTISSLWGGIFFSIFC